MLYTFETQSEPDVEDILLWIQLLAPDLVKKKADFSKQTLTYATDFYSGYIFKILLSGLNPNPAFAYWTVIGFNF